MLKQLRISKTFFLFFKKKLVQNYGLNKHAFIFNRVLPDTEIMLDVLHVSKFWYIKTFHSLSFDCQRFKRSDFQKMWAFIIFILEEALKLQTTKNGMKIIIFRIHILYGKENYSMACVLFLFHIFSDRFCQFRSGSLCDIYDRGGLEMASLAFFIRWLNFVRPVEYRRSVKYSEIFRFKRSSA